MYFILENVGKILDLQFSRLDSIRLENNDVLKVLQGVSFQIYTLFSAIVDFEVHRKITFAYIPFCN